MSQDHGRTIADGGRGGGAVARHGGAGDFGVVDELCATGRAVDVEAFALRGDGPAWAIAAVRRLTALAAAAPRAIGIVCDMALHVRDGIARAGLLPRVRPWRPRAAEHAIDGRRVLLTGGSSGIGRAAALRLAALGAELTLVARRADELERVRKEIAELGGTAHTVACDLTDAAAVSDMAEQVLDRWGTVDVLINNAGRSIRRPVRESLDRFHDFERTMAVNYFGAVALTLRVLPAMLENGGGHVVNVGTWGVSAGSMPKYAAYYSSKAALTAFGDSLGAELRGRGITVTSVQYPLVRTPMSEATEDYRNLTALTPQDAAEWLVTALRRRPDTMYPRYVSTLRLIAALAPHRRDRILLDIA